MDMTGNTPFVVKLRNMEDETTGDAHIVFKIKKTSHRTGVVYVPREKADDVDSLLSMFKQKNAELPTDPEKAKLIIAQAIKAPPQRHSLRVKHVGWAQSSPRWPDGRSQKSFTFRDPFPNGKASRNA
jgi:hypothetical protein